MTRRDIESACVQTRRDGLQFAREKGVAKLQLETDCQELVSLWSRG